MEVITKELVFNTLKLLAEHQEILFPLQRILMVHHSNIVILLIVITNITILQITLPLQLKYKKDLELINILKDSNSITLSTLYLPSLQQLRISKFL